jgi:gamma-butyrobetaine dioxygenase
MDCIETILTVFEARGASEYLGEPVTQLEHALQTADLAVLDGASVTLVVAALLHDIGHILTPGDDPALRGIDGLHEERGCAWLARHFGPEVTEPVRLHVLAKRYLCSTDDAYLRTLSPASVRSLELQGGRLTGDEIARFEENAFSRDALRLRRWDDAAKEPAKRVPGVERYVEALRSVVIQP